MAFTINGRFTTQQTTGVQRYAREVLRAMEDQLRIRGRAAALVTPPGGVLPHLSAVAVQPAGPLHGHMWEQVTLPARTRGPLLNLCNTAPLALRDQVVCMHDANVYRWPGSYTTGFRLLYKTLQPLLARRAATVASVSQAAARQLADHLPIAARDIAVLGNGHEHVHRWDASRSRLFAEAPARRRFVLLIGSRARHKNADLVLGLAGSLDALGLDLMVAGGGGAVFADSGRRAAPNLRLLGAVSDDDLASLYAQALCLAFPSFTEGFGLPILEAMALGCPVVSSDRASMPEVCGTAALMASPDDPAAWLAHIRALAASPTLCEDLRGRGRTRAMAFSWADTARGYLDLMLR